MNICLAFFEQFVDLGGGIERVLCRLANAMTDRGHHVSIVYCYGQDGRPFYPLSEEVTLYNLMDQTPWKESGQRFTQGLPLSARIGREVLRLFDKKAARNWNLHHLEPLIVPPIQQAMAELQPDVILSFRPETSHYLLQGAKVTIPVVSMFHGTPSRMIASFLPCERRAMEKSACLHVLLSTALPAVRAAFPHAHIVCIPNDIPACWEQADLAAPKARYTIVHVGRLDKKYKQQHLLIEAFAALAEDFPDWDVEFWGGDDPHGRYLAELKGLIDKYHLSHRVKLMGKTSRVQEVYLQGDLFCFPSASEGFGLALGEAMSAGLPAIGFRSCQAASELIKDGESGLLADDGPAGLATALRRLMADRELRITMGGKARAAMAAYAPERIWVQWEDLLRAVTTGAPLP